MFNLRKSYFLNGAQKHAGLLSISLLVVALVGVAACTDQEDAAEPEALAPKVESNAIHKSPPETLMKFVETIGFLDGVTCESWPKNVNLTNGTAVADVISYCSSNCAKL